MRASLGKSTANFRLRKVLFHDFLQRESDRNGDTDVQQVDHATEPPGYRVHHNLGLKETFEIFKLKQKVRGVFCWRF